MTDKNPYENQDSVDIEDFAAEAEEEKKKKHSFFNIDDEDEDESLEEDEEEEEERVPEYRRVRKEIIIVSCCLIVLLLVLSIVSLIYGFSKNKNYNNLKADYEAYVSKTAASETALNNQIADLKKQVEELTKKDPAVVDPVNGSSYKIVATAGINVRNAVASSTFANYDLLPDNVKTLCANNGGSVTIEGGKVVTVLETANNGSDVWGRIADNAWICLKNGDEDWAVKQ